MGDFDICHGQGCRVFLGMGDLPPLMTGILKFHGAQEKPLRTWVDEFIPYGNNGSGSTLAHISKGGPLKVQEICCIPSVYPPRTPGCNRHK